jgi:hypothetical protein
MAILRTGGKTLMGHTIDFSSFRKTLLAGAMLAGSMLLFGTPQTRADEDDCQKRIVHMDHELHRADSEIPNVLAVTLFFSSTQHFERQSV